MQYLCHRTHRIKLPFKQPYKNPFFFYTYTLQFFITHASAVPTRKYQSQSTIGITQYIFITITHCTVHNLLMPSNPTSRSPQCIIITAAHQKRYLHEIVFPFSHPSLSMCPRGQNSRAPGKGRNRNCTCTHSPGRYTR